MKNSVQRGDVLTVTATAAVSSGDGVQIGQIFGVAVTDAANTEQFSLAVVGVFNLNKNGAQAWTEGQLLYWDGTEVTTTASGNLPIGAAAAAALAADATGPVVLGLGKPDAA